MSSDIGRPAKGTEPGEARGPHLKGYEEILRWTRIRRPCLRQRPRPRPLPRGFSRSISASTPSSPGSA
ncbi:protein of unknown function [Rhodovastum atsumiense]|nr:protein of unknown function [Rhodovastum atsumiense]